MLVGKIVGEATDIEEEDGFVGEFTIEERGILDLKFDFDL